MCGNGGHLILCSSAKCSRAICIGPGTECLAPPVDSHFIGPDILFICPPCHQDKDRKAKQPSPYFVSPISQPVSVILNSQTCKAFYVTPGDKPLYDTPAQICGSAQLIPRAKFLGNGAAILNFHLGDFHQDTADLGKILQPFAAAFFPKADQHLLLFQDIVFDLAQSGHEQKIQGVIEQLRAAQ